MVNHFKKRGRGGGDGGLIQYKRLLTCESAVSKSLAAILYFIPSSSLQTTSNLKYFINVL